MQRVYWGCDGVQRVYWGCDAAQTADGCSCAEQGVSGNLDDSPVDGCYTGADDGGLRLVARRSSTSTLLRIHSDQLAHLTW